MSGTDAAGVKQCIRSLKRVERYVVLMYFADELTIDEIGLVLSLAAAQVQQILADFRQRVSGVLSHSEDPSEARTPIDQWSTALHSAEG